MSCDPNNVTRIAAQKRRAAKTSVPAAPKPRNRRISFADALAYAEDMDRRSGEVQGYTASEAHSHLFTSKRYGDNVWSLLSDGDEWLACVWVDDDGRYHIARDLDRQTEEMIELPHPDVASLPAERERV